MPKLVTNPAEVLADLDSYLETADLTPAQRRAYTAQRDALSGALITGEGIDQAAGQVVGTLGNVANYIYGLAW